MPIGSRMVSFSLLFLVALLSHETPGIVGAADSAPPHAFIQHHELFVQIVPEQHFLIVKDRLTLEVSQAPIRFSLAPALQIDRITLVHSSSGGAVSTHDVPFNFERGSSPELTQQVTFPSNAISAGSVTLGVHYPGVINDPPREPRHLRFVTPSETAGHIGAEGVYLSSETQWYLDVPDSISEYRLRVALPAGWTAVTQSKVRSSGACPADLCSKPDLVLTEWDPIQSAEALTLVANRFVAKTREWSSQGGQRLQLGAYLFPEDAQLADEYLDATA